MPYDKVSGTYKQSRTRLSWSLDEISNYSAREHKHHCGVGETDDWMMCDNELCKDHQNWFDNQPARKPKKHKTGKELNPNL